MEPQLIIVLIGPEHEVVVQRTWARVGYRRTLNVGQVRRRRDRYEAFAFHYCHDWQPMLIQLGESFGSQSAAVDEILRVAE